MPIEVCCCVTSGGCHLKSGDLHPLYGSGNGHRNFAGIARITVTALRWSQHRWNVVWSGVYCVVDQNGDRIEDRGLLHYEIIIVIENWKFSGYIRLTVLHASDVMIGNICMTPLLVTLSLRSNLHILLLGGSYSEMVLTAFRQVNLSPGPSHY